MHIMHIHPYLFESLHMAAVGSVKAKLVQSRESARRQKAHKAEVQTAGYEPSCGLVVLTDMPARQSEEILHGRSLTVVKLANMCTKHSFSPATGPQT